MVTSVLQVTDPASDLALLSIEELRAAAGLAAGDDSQDTALEALGLEAAEWVAGIIGVRAAGIQPPTVLSEGLRETFRGWAHGYRLVLARRFVTSVSAVTENGAALIEGTDFVLNESQGVIERIASDFPLAWIGGPIIVDYVAGFGAGSPTTIPATIKAVASDYVRIRYGVGTVDPEDIRVRSETTNDLDSVSYFDAATSQSAFEQAARERLSRFIASRGFA